MYLRGLPFVKIYQISSKTWKWEEFFPNAGLENTPTLVRMTAFQFYLPTSSNPNFFFFVGICVWKRKSESKQAFKCTAWLQRVIRHSLYPSRLKKKKKGWGGGVKWSPACHWRWWLVPLCSLCQAPEPCTSRTCCSWRSPVSLYSPVFINM